jgi:uncharacterized membrane protein YbaN (DUF454 family)
MKQRLWRYGKITLGMLLLVLGFVGLFLPFLQGILFLIMGLSLLSTESPRAKAWLEYLEERTGWERLKGHRERRRLDDA